MKNPFGDQQVPGSYHNLKERMYKKVLADVNEQILKLLIDSYENALNSENILLARVERKRLLFQVSELVCKDVLENLEVK